MPGMNNWDFAPEIVYDLKNGYINSYTMAFGIGKKLSTKIVQY